MLFPNFGNVEFQIKNAANFAAFFGTIKFSQLCG